VNSTRYLRGIMQRFFLSNPFWVKHKPTGNIICIGGTVSALGRSTRVVMVNYADVLDEGDNPLYLSLEYHFPNRHWEGDGIPLDEWGMGLKGFQFTPPNERSTGFWGNLPITFEEEWVDILVSECGRWFYEDTYEIVPVPNGVNVLTGEAVAVA